MPGGFTVRVHAIVPDITCVCVQGVRTDLRRRLLRYAARPNAPVAPGANAAAGAGADSGPPGAGTDNVQLQGRVEQQR